MLEDTIPQDSHSENDVSEVLSKSEAANDVSQEKGKRKRSVRTFPTLSYEESLTLGNAIWQYASGQRIRRTTLFDHIGKSPDSGPSRSLITASSKYGITIGGYQADYIELTGTGQVATNPEETPAKRTEANFKLAIGSNSYFDMLYQQFNDMKLPSNSVMVDFLQEQGLEEEECKKGVELFIINSKFIGIIKVLSGSERIIPIEQLMEEQLTFPGDQRVKQQTPEKPEVFEDLSGIGIGFEPNGDKWSKMCFYISPIGEEESEQRKHSDLFLSSIVEPALNEFGFSVVRADNISTPGMITSQIIEHIVNARLVIADLSYHNPNVFYELSLRHTVNLPTIHLIRKSDTIPFDLNNFRTITIDTSSIYTLVPQIESYKTAIGRQVRQLIESPETMDNPISAYLTKAKVNIKK